MATKRKKRLILEKERATHPHKTAKRLAIKKEMLEAKAKKGKNKIKK